MPGTNLARARPLIRGLDGFAEGFFVAVAALRVEHFELGAEIHLSKPINANELIAQIQISLGNLKEHCRA